MARVAWIARVVLVAAVAGCGGGSGRVDGAAGTTGAAGAAPGDAAPDLPAANGGAGGLAEPPTDAAAESSRGEVAICALCGEYGAPTQSGTIVAPALDQLSGIAVSHRNPGILFVHNDRTSTVVWAVSEAGALLGTYAFTGVPVHDVEDIAVGPCPSGTCIFLADIGGNLGTGRTDFTIVRFPEPTVTAGGSATISVIAEKLVFTYPDGVLRNAESLLVDPSNGMVYVIDKVAAGMHSTAYKLSATFSEAPIVATKVGELPVPAAGDMPATSANAHPCGTGFILATGNAAYEFRIAPGTPFEDAFKATPISVPVAAEQQREGISYQPDGRGYFTNSEGPTQPIHHTTCK